MRYVVPLLLLLATPAFADRDPVKCGRALAARMYAIGLGGGGELHLPKGCQRVLVPAPYTVATTSLGPVVMNPDGSVAASFLVPTERPAVDPQPCAVAIARDYGPAPRRHGSKPSAVAGFHRRQIEHDGHAVDILVED